MTCILLFTFTRLDNIPRSTPLIHALILCAGLIAIRALLIDSNQVSPVELLPSKSRLPQ
jgi:hypothetical protein